MYLFRRFTSLNVSIVVRWQWTSSLLFKRATQSFQNTTTNDEVEHYLVDNFQVSQKPAKILSKACTLGDIEDRIRYFKSIGLSETNIAVVFRKFPRPIMGCDVKEMEKRVEFLSGYTTQFRDPNVLITHLIPQYPQLLFHPLDAMKNRVQLLQKCQLTDEEVAKVLRYNPMTILTKLEDTFDDLVQYLRDSGLPEKTIHKFFTKQPRSITYRWEAIEKRVRFFMDELGYSRERIIEVFTNNPMVMTANVERMRERSMFIKDEMGLSNISLIKSPLVLRYSLDRLKWRYQYLCQIGYLVTDETYLLNILYLTDKLFARYIAKRPLPDILEFKEQFYENLASPSHNPRNEKDTNLDVLD